MSITLMCATRGCENSKLIEDGGVIDKQYWHCEHCWPGGEPRQRMPKKNHPDAVDEFSDKVKEIQVILDELCKHGHMNKHKVKILVGIRNMLESLVLGLWDKYYVRLDAQMNSLTQEYED